MTVYVGTSGWQYKDWRTAFYPKRLPQREWLPYFADRFRVVEVNNTFYHLPKAEVFRTWRERTPPDFLFALKMSRYLTHLKRLREPEAPVERFLAAAAELREKMGPILLQLPPNMDVDVARLRAALDAFPRGVRLALEFRDDSWFSKPVREALSERDAALCLADREEELITPEWRTAGWGYLRFHWGKATPASCYSDAAIGRWAERIASLWDQTADVFAFFNNDPYGCAVHDARRLAEALVRQGLQATRVPSREEIKVREG